MSDEAAYAALAAKLGHDFARPELLRQALTHSSSTQGARLSSNERLEFIGDRVLGLVVAEWLIERFPTEREGDIGKRHSISSHRCHRARRRNISRSVSGCREKDRSPNDSRFKREAA